MQEVLTTKHEANNSIALYQNQYTLNNTIMDHFTLGIQMYYE